jgi:FkbM family methyltransferase
VIGSFIRRRGRRALQRVGISVTRFPPTDSHLFHDRLRYLLDRMRINCVLDVGASQGEYGLRLRDLGYRGHIVSFEPVAENAAVLREHCARDGKWHAHHLALGESNRTTSINIVGHSTGHSLLPLTEYAADQFGSYSTIQRTEEVRMVRLDDVLDEYTAHVEQPRLFLKIDTQGYDLKVIEGLGDRIDRIIGLQTELSVRAIYQDAPRYYDALGYLDRLGFEPVDFVAVGREADGLHAMEFDCILLNRAYPAPAPDR